MRLTYWDSSNVDNPWCTFNLAFYVRTITSNVGPSNHFYIVNPYSFGRPVIRQFLTSLDRLYHLLTKARLKTSYWLGSFKYQIWHRIMYQAYSKFQQKRNPIFPIFKVWRFRIRSPRKKNWQGQPLRPPSLGLVLIWNFQKRWSDDLFLSVPLACSFLLSECLAGWELKRTRCWSNESTWRSTAGAVR
jgi:hypothetical protein